MRNVKNLPRTSLEGLAELCRDLVFRNGDGDLDPDNEMKSCVDAVDAITGWLGDNGMYPEVYGEEPEEAEGERPAAMKILVFTQQGSR